MVSLQAIPTSPGGANHTPEFTKSTATPEAHQATLNVSKALAAVGFRVLADDGFFEEVCALPVPCTRNPYSGASAQVKKTFEKEKAAVRVAHL